MNKNKSFIDKVESFQVRKEFKIGKVHFEKGDIYNRLDVYNEGEYFMSFDYDKISGELTAIKEISLSKLRKNYKRIKNHIHVLDIFSKDSVNQAFSFSSVKTIQLNKELNGLEKGWRFTRESGTDLFTYSITSKSEVGSETVSSSLTQKAVENLYNTDGDLIQIVEFFEKKTDVEIGSDLKEFLDWEKEATKLQESVSDWKAEYIKVSNELNFQKEVNLSNVKHSKLELDKFDKVKSEINRLYKMYEYELSNIDIVDELEFDKIEKGTVLENLLTVVKSLNKMF